MNKTNSRWLRPSCLPRRPRGGGRFAGAGWEGQNSGRSLPEPRAARGRCRGRCWGRGGARRCPRGEAEARGQRPGRCRCWCRSAPAPPWRDRPSSSAGRAPGAVTPKSCPRRSGAGAGGRRCRQRDARPGTGAGNKSIGGRWRQGRALAGRASPAPSRLPAQRRDGAPGGGRRAERAPPAGGGRGQRSGGCRYRPERRERGGAAERSGREPAPAADGAAGAELSGLSPEKSPRGAWGESGLAPRRGPSRAGAGRAARPAVIYGLPGSGSRAMGGRGSRVSSSPSIMDGNKYWSQL